MVKHRKKEIEKNNHLATLFELKEGAKGRDVWKKFLENCVSYKSLEYINSLEEILFELIYRRLRFNNDVQVSAINAQFERSYETML